MTKHIESYALLASNLKLDTDNRTCALAGKADAVNTVSNHIANEYDWYVKQGFNVPLTVVKACMYAWVDYEVHLNLHQVFLVAELYTIYCANNSTATGFNLLRYDDLTVYMQEVLELEERHDVLATIKMLIVIKEHEKLSGLTNDLKDYDKTRKVLDNMHFLFNCETLHGLITWLNQSK